MPMPTDLAAIGSVAERLNRARAQQRELMISQGASASAAMERYPDVCGAEISAPAELVEAIMTLPEEDQQALAEGLGSGGDPRCNGRKRLRLPLALNMTKQKKPPRELEPGALSPSSVSARRSSGEWQNSNCF